jgi:hypothetical protein
MLRRVLGAISLSCGSLSSRFAAMGRSRVEGYCTVTETVAVCALPDPLEGVAVTVMV